jgi:hypothetical protein
MLGRSRTRISPPTYAAPARFQKQKTKAGGIDGGETGSVPLVQRFDGTLESFVPLHVLALDGVFTRAEDGAAVLHEGPAPSRDELASVAACVAERMLRWMRRRTLLDDRPRQEGSNEAPEVSPLEACMQLSLFGVSFVKLDKDGAPFSDPDDEQRLRPRTKSPWSADKLGFNLHAGVTVRAGDRDGVERLCR